MRLSHLSAAAVLVALVAAMFVSLGSVRAEAIGKCSSGLAELGISDTCTVDVPTGAGVTVTAINDDTALGKANAIKTSKPSVATVADDGTVTALALGSTMITVRTYTAPVTANPNNNPPILGVKEEIDDEVYRIVVRKVAVTKIEFGSIDLGADGEAGGTGADADTFIADTDNIFSAGTDVVVRVTSSFSSVDTVAFTVTAPTTGLSLLTGTPASPTAQRLSSTAGEATRDAGKVTVKSPLSAFTLVTDGAPEAEYTITAQASTGADATLVRSAKFTAKLTIGDAGNTVGSASLSLGLREGFDTPGDATDDKPETGSAGAGGSVNLVLNVKNGIGSNANAADVRSILVVAPFGSVSYLSGTDFQESPNKTIPSSALSSGSVIIKVASDGSKERTVDVHVIVLGTVAGSPETNSLTLTFTGAANAISIDDGSKTLRNVNVERDKDDKLVPDTITLVVKAMDKSGNATSPPPGLAITITDPDGNGVGRDKIEASPPEQGIDGIWRITVTNKSGNSAAAALKTGEYTLKAKSGSIEDTATFTVAGAVDTISAEVNDMNPSELGQQLTVTATVVDKDGAAAADDTMVNFESSEDKIAKRVGTTGEVKTKDGKASATFVVTGPGLVVLTASTGGKTASVVITSTAGAVQQAEDDEPETLGLHCLSSNQGFATYSCGIDASASEIFGLVSGRGATAVHLWNGSAWVRYSVVDGQEVPGSSDFMVAENDILYISN